MTFKGHTQNEFCFAERLSPWHSKSLILTAAVNIM